MDIVLDGESNSDSLYKRAGLTCSSATVSEDASADTLGELTYGLGDGYEAGSSVTFAVERHRDGDGAEASSSPDENDSRAWRLRGTLLLDGWKSGFLMRCVGGEG